MIANQCQCCLSNC